MYFKHYYIYDEEAAVSADDDDDKTHHLLQNKNNKIIKPLPQLYCIFNQICTVSSPPKR